MLLNPRIRLVCVILLLLGLVSSITLVSPAVCAITEIEIIVNPDRLTLVNNLSLGFQLSHEWLNWLDRPILRQLAEDANFRMVRILSTEIEPCVNWDESTKTGTFRWTSVDSLVDSIFALGAEPLICVGRADAIGYNLPRGLVINPSTGLPYPNSWAAYCAEWVKHFKQTGKPVRYYEIINEPWVDGGLETNAKIANYMKVFNAAAQAMRAANPSVLLGFDGSTRRHVLDYWLKNGGANLDFLSFHKYDSSSIGRYTDQQMFTRAETYEFETTSFFYGVTDARQTYYDARGKMIPVINSESNYNAAWEDGTDPKIQQMAGAVWTALVLRTGVLKGLSYNVYNRYTTSASWALRNNPSGGRGMGLINSDDNKPWYPYYVHWILGPNLAVGDNVVETTSSSSSIRPLAWVHGDKLNILLICKVDDPRDVRLYGLQGSINYFKIDNTISWRNPKLQTGSMYSTNTLSLEGYTIILLQTQVNPHLQIFEDGFESGSFNAWTGTSTSSGAAATIVTTRAHHGSYSARFTSNGGGGREESYCYVDVEPSSELYARGYFYVSQSGIVNNDDRFYFMRFRADGNNVAYAGWRRTGGVVRWSLIIRDGTGWAMTSSSSSPSLNRWYCVELRWVEGSANGRGELYVDGELVCSIGGRNTAALGSVDQVWFGLAELYGCGSTTAFCDSCEILRGSESVSGDINGDGVIDVVDLVIVAKALGTQSGDQNWNPVKDLNGDRIVDIIDLTLVGTNFG